jgi:hypothetical protein
MNIQTAIQTYPRPQGVSADSSAYHGDRIDDYLNNVTEIVFMNARYTIKRDAVMGIIFGHDQGTAVAVVEEDLLPILEPDLTLDVSESHGAVSVLTAVSYGDVKKSRETMLRDFTNSETLESATEKVNALLKSHSYETISIEALQNALFGKFGMLTPPAQKGKSSYKTVSLTRCDDDARYFEGDDGMTYSRGLILSQEKPFLPEVDSTMSGYKRHYRLAKWALSVGLNLPRYERVLVCETRPEYESLLD